MAKILDWLKNFFTRKVIVFLAIMFICGFVLGFVAFWLSQVYK